MILNNIYLFFFITDVVPYSAHIPSYADTWGWVMVLLLYEIKTSYISGWSVKIITFSSQNKKKHYFV